MAPYPPMSPYPRIPRINEVRAAHLSAVNKRLSELNQYVENARITAPAAILQHNQRIAELNRQLEEASVSAQISGAFSTTSLSSVWCIGLMNTAETNAPKLATTASVRRYNRNYRYRKAQEKQAQDAASQARMRELAVARY